MDVTTQTFDQDVLEQYDLPVVVDFWAAWCGPCRMLGPVLDREGEARDGQLVVAKVDVDANPDLAERYGVQGIPVVKAFRDGRVIDEFVGALPPAAVAQFLDALTGPTRREQLIAEPKESGDSPEALAALEAGDDERALELLLEAISAARDEERERLLGLTVGLFGELGDEHPLTMRYRRRLAASLY